MPLKALLVLALAGLVSGCYPIGLGPRHYYGRFEVSCAGTGQAPAEEMDRVAQMISSRLGRPLEALPEGKLIPYPPEPAIVFSAHTTQFHILIRASDPDEDEPTRAVRVLIDQVLQTSPCADRRFYVFHTTFAGG